MQHKAKPRDWASICLNVVCLAFPVLSICAPLLGHTPQSATLDWWHRYGNSTFGLYTQWLFVASFLASPLVFIFAKNRRVEEAAGRIFFGTSLAVLSLLALSRLVG